MPFADVNEEAAAAAAGLDAKRARTFVGDGSKLLPVSGCTAVDAVQVGTALLPGEVVDMIPEDPTLKRLVEVREPVYLLSNAPDGGAVLLRNERSNDGIWQAGVQITVWGTWEKGK